MPVRRYLALCVCLFAALAICVRAQEVLTNETLINMTKAHVNDATIVDMIEKQPGKYVVTSTALIALKQAGVSDAVITAMRAKTTGATAPRSPVRSATTAPSTSSACGSNGGWRLRDRKDPLTGQSFFDACQSAPSEGGVFQTTATCDGDSVSLKILYGSRQNIGYHLIDGTTAFPKPHVAMRLSIDGGQPIFWHSTATDFNNEATLTFYERTILDNTPGGQVLVQALGGNNSPGTPEELYKARLIKIQLPLANGDVPILEIHPQDPEFRKFSSRCAAIKESDVRAAHEEELRQKAEQEQAIIQNAGPIVRKYGMPSISDSHDALVWKAEELKDKALGGYWNNSNRHPIWDQMSNEPDVAAASGVPGSQCDEIFDPGDVAPDTIDWAAKDTQFVIVRCRDRKGHHVWGQMELTITGLEELQRRRDQLLSLGVRATPAPSEPDTPVGPRPARWTKDSWASRRFYVCSSSQFYPNPLGPRPFVPSQPTWVQLVSHPGTWYYLGKPEGQGAVTYEFKWDALHETADACPPPSSDTTSSNPAVLTIPPTLPRALQRGQYWVLDDPLAALQQAGVGVPVGTTPREVLRTACAKGEETCKKVLQSFDANALAKAPSDAAGQAVLTGAPPGRHYVVLYAAYDDRAFFVYDSVDLKPGPNSVDFRNLVPKR